MSSSLTLAEDSSTRAILTISYFIILLTRVDRRYRLMKAEEGCWKNVNVFLILEIPCGLTPKQVFVLLVVRHPRKVCRRCDAYRSAGF